MTTEIISILKDYASRPVVVPDVPFKLMLLYGSVAKAVGFRNIAVYEYEQIN